ncbi:MAG: hypothetical protein PVJ33_13650 [Lysobacterales bacterium]|jgi:hypothetical protein
MKDILIPFGLLLFIGLFVYAVMSTARKQRKTKADVFRNFAKSNDLEYQEEDDGKAQRFAKDFDGIGQYESPSLGKIIPNDVVEGRLNGTEAILFRHRVRYSEGWAREWFVAGITNEQNIAERCAVQFCRGSADKDTIYLQDPVVKELDIPPFLMVVRASEISAAGKTLDEGVLKQLADLAEDLSFRPEIQIRENRLVAYPADRNMTVEDAETIENLFEFARSAARKLEP